MRRLLIWLPMILTACTGNLMGPEVPLGGPLGRFGHALSRLPDTPAPVATAAPEIAALPVESPEPRWLVSTPMPPTPTPPPRPTPSPSPSPVPTPTPEIWLLPPDPVASATAPPSMGLTTVSVKGRTISFILWDYGNQDGDRIRLTLNGLPVEAARDLSLLNSGTRLTLGLRSGRNLIRCTALNEGDYTPNTFMLRLDPDQLFSGSAIQASRGLLVGESETLTVYAP